MVGARAPRNAGALQRASHRPPAVSPPSTPIHAAKESKPPPAKDQSSGEELPPALLTAKAPRRRVGPFCSLSLSSSGPRAATPRQGGGGRQHRSDDVVITGSSLWPEVGRVKEEFRRISATPPVIELTFHAAEVCLGAPDREMQQRALDDLRRLRDWPHGLCWAS
jgi:hypothetical protein